MQPTREELEAIAGISSAQKPTREELEAIAGTTSKLKIKEETHPDITFMDRFKIKNFGTDLDSSAKYLQNKYPDHEIKVHRDRILMKRDNEKEFKPLDPEGFDWQDITDVGYDIGAGILEGAATAAGGVAGFAAGGGVGAIPAGMLAGGASSASLEALRQKLGQALGVTEEMDPTQIKAAGAVGAVSPLLFGTGAGAKQLLKKGLTGEVAEAAQKGVLGRAYQKATRKVAPTIAQAASGVEKDSYKIAIKNPELLERIEEMGGEQAYIDDLGKTLEDVLVKEKRAAGAKLGEVRASSDIMDIGAVRADIDKKIGEFEQKLVGEGLDESEEMIYNTLLDVNERAFTNKVKGNEGEIISQDVGSRISPGRIMSALETIRFGGAIYDDPMMKKKADKLIDPMLEKWAHGLKKTLDNIPGRQAEARRYGEAVDALSNLARYKDKTNPDAPYGEKLQSLLKRATTTKDRKFNQINKIAQKRGVDLKQENKAINAYRYLYKPSITPISSGGATSTSRTIPTAMIGGGLGAFLGPSVFGDQGRPLGGAIGVGIGAMLGSPSAMKALLKQGYRQDQLMKGALEYSKEMMPGNRQQYLQSVWNALAKQEKEE